MGRDQLMQEQKQLQEMQRALKRESQAQRLADSTAKGFVEPLGFKTDNPTDSGSSPRPTTQVSSSPGESVPGTEIPWRWMIL